MKWAEASPAIFLVEYKIAEFVLSPASRAESIYFYFVPGVCTPGFMLAPASQATKVQADISKWNVTQKKMPRGASRHFEVRPDYVLADSRPAKDTAENAASIAVAAVSITAVLSITLGIALLEAAAKGLRRSIPPIV